MSTARQRPPVPARVPPVVIEAVSPRVDAGRFPAKAVVGDPFVVSATVFSHGHDVVRAFVRVRPAGGAAWQRTTMSGLGNDAFRAVVVPEEPGRLEVEVLGEVDELATWRRDASRRVDAGRYDQNDAISGAELLEAVAERLGASGESLGRAGAAALEPARLAAMLRELAGRLAAAQSAPAVAAVLQELVAFDDALSARSPDTAAPAAERFEVAVQRELAACSSWYECFPRSTSPDRSRPGTLRDLIAQLDYVADLGFDLLYLPPIHPIGVTARKGPNNTAAGGPDAVGSPWAIGNSHGGHTAVAPELGTIEDFDALVSEAARRGIEIALDLAFQCSPDHPWVHQHPDWFAHRPDGTIACAENPPKRYEDVYPIDFATADREGLYRELLDVVRFWHGRGVRTFRVDNPHTKPFDFWEWLIAAVHAEDPGVIFLAEAFTRPAVMHRLAKLGFDQSYTYFTWRDTKWELTEYLGELAHGPGAAYFRGNLWPNTPDILAKSLQRGGRPSFVVRLVLAACGSANYGIYGPMFELLFDRPAAPGSEEYLDSEKYEVRHFDLEDPRGIASVIRRLNGARRTHPALRRDASLRFHEIDNDQLICWSKRDPQTGDAVCCVVNLDPHWTQSGFVALDLDALGLSAHEPFVVRDLLDDRAYVWNGSRNFVVLEPGRDNAHVLAIEPLNGPGSP